ncbi:MAG: hypothetical protein CMN79_03785 [Spirochaetales bacterium]|jgi:hypothetical protein|nr:hypothetical protein [Spirochaetales bacterium]|tara:strand:+ start:2008 stop:2505 length:498 start_codon:yes stop_codon:yes gene_type:complete
MRFFVTKDLNKNSALKLIIFFALIFFIGLIITNFLFMYKIGFTPSSVIEYYLGNPDVFREPKSYGSLVEETHFHLFAMGIILMTLNHLMLFSNLKNSHKVLIIIISFTSCLLDISSSWLVRYVSSSFSLLKVTSMIVEQVFLLLLIIIITQSIFLKNQKEEVTYK